MSIHHSTPPVITPPPSGTLDLFAAPSDETRAIGLKLAWQQAQERDIRHQARHLRACQVDEAEVVAYVERREAILAELLSITEPEFWLSRERWDKVAEDWRKPVCTGCGGRGSVIDGRCLQCQGSRREVCGA